MENGELFFHTPLPTPNPQHDHEAFHVATLKDKRIERSEHEQLRCNGTLPGGIFVTSYALCIVGLANLLTVNAQSKGP